MRMLIAIFITFMFVLPNCKAAEANSLAFKQMTEQLKSVTDVMQQVQLVNTIVNADIRHVSDLALWNQPDYWATPKETLARHAGDCEDIAILKYYLLLASGVSSDNLRLVYGSLLTDQGSAEKHVVLAYTATGNEPLILDNTVKTVVALSHRPDFKPHFSFDQVHVWLGLTDQVFGPAHSLNGWAQVQARVRSGQR